MPKSVVLDAHLLVLLVVGRFDRSLIGRHKRLSAYDEDGFDLLVEILDQYSTILLTPNSLTEASNLLRLTGDPHQTLLTLALGEFIRENDERFVVSNDASMEQTFGRLGLTDAALIIASREEATLLSADNDLYLAASREGIDALNFAHLYAAKFI
jgi:hypothetical protein